MIEGRIVSRTWFVSESSTINNDIPGGRYEIGNTKNPPSLP